jgi:hypothetical protein
MPIKTVKISGTYKRHLRHTDTVIFHNGRFCLRTSRLVRTKKVPHSSLAPLQFLSALGWSFRLNLVGVYVPKNSRSFHLSFGDEFITFSMPFSPLCLNLLLSLGIMLRLIKNPILVPNNQSEDGTRTE